jgi:hypothetical protein
LTLNEWTVLFAIIVSVFFLLLALRQCRSNWRKSFRGLLVFAGLFGGFLLVCLASAAHKEFFVQSSVVIVPEAVVRLGPFEESQSAFTLRDGAEVTVQAQKDNWLQITDASQRTGWIPQKQLMPLGALK